MTDDDACLELSALALLISLTTVVFALLLARRTTR